MIVIGSRGSELALWQSRHVAAAVQQATGVECRIEVIETTGDRVLERPLDAIGVKGAFTVELEEALREGRIDAAVHSLKDLPVEDPDGLTLGAIPERADPRDVLVIARRAHAPDTGLLPLSVGARVGTSSPRRPCAAHVLRDDLDVADIRGNVPTRAEKVRRADYDATLLAAAGIDRLGLDLDGLVRRELEPELFTPAPGQGALAVQCRRDDRATIDTLRSIHDEATARCVTAERALLLALGGGCSMPLGALVAKVGDAFRLRASYFGGPGPSVVRADAVGADPERLVERVAEQWQGLVGEPLRGARVGLVRPDGEPGSLADAIGVAGAAVEVLPWTRVEPIRPAAEDLARALSAGAIALTSARAVEHLADACRSADVPLPLDRPAFAAGPATAAAARRAGFAPAVPQDGSGGEALSECIESADLPHSAAIAFPCADDRLPTFEACCRAADRTVIPLPLYRVVPDADAPPADGTLDAFVFTSPSAAAAFVARHVERPRATIAIGPTTAAALSDHGLRADAVAERPTPPAVVAALVHALQP